MILAGVICNEFVYWTGSSLSPLATIIVGARPPAPPRPRSRDAPRKQPPGRAR
jgi:hypothetical protein